MISEKLDNLIAVFSPQWAAKRVAFRYQMSRISAATGIHESMRKMVGRNSGGYEAGKLDRLNGRISGSPHENDIPRQQIYNLRWRSWNLYRNNPQARKIRRSLTSKVIGRGLSPQPQTLKRDGQPFVEFRRRARHVWKEFCKECDYRGKPGMGGQNFVGLSKSALGANLFSGGVLFRFHHLTPARQRALGLYLPLQIQLLHADRLDETKHGDEWFYGVKLDSEGRVVGYQVLRGGTINQTKAVGQDSFYIPAGNMRHLFAEEDIDQIIGSPWFGAALLTMDDRRNYEYTELVAAEMAACIVAGYRRSSGQQGGIGLSTDGNRDLVDADGNPVTRLQPGMFLDLGQTGELQIASAQRPNANIGDVLAHFIRSEAVSVAGIKSSTLTGDYRNSSFSSERSADNDIWPEIEELQDWFSTGLHQPVYEECIQAAVLGGKFDDVPGFSAADFVARQREYLECNWQGPVARSINPKDDATAALLRIKGGTSSPQREAAQIGRDWREILQEVAEYIEFAEEVGVPKEVWQQGLGIEPQPPTEATADDGPSEQQQDDHMRDLFRHVDHQFNSAN